ncbi:MAG: ATP-dependent DNA helicase, partial [Candidatus Omnitrophota bacterium]
MMKLNKEQQKAATLLDGPLLVVAGPGTGKTHLLSARAANIVREKKADPENILILTFTNAAARAMRERLAALLGRDGYNIEVETFHSFANSIVLESEKAIKYVKDKIDMQDVEKIKALEYIMDSAPGVEPLKPFGVPYIHLNEVQHRISELKNEGISPEGFKKQIKTIEENRQDLEEKYIARLKALALIYEKYENLKNADSSILFDQRGRKDYDDMILIALLALRSEKELRESFCKQYKYIMVDEYQDTNGAQLELLFLIMNSKSPNICCVGDDDQSIYRFQGATLANFRILREKLPSMPTIVLKDSYRSTQDIVDLSRKIISQIPDAERITRKELATGKKYKNSKIDFLEFLTETEELAYLIGEIKKQVVQIKKDNSLLPEERKKPYNQIAVLVRKRSQRQKVIQAFLAAGIPYAADGNENIRQEKRVQQMLDILELANVSTENNDKKSLALYKVLSSDYASIRQADILKFIAFVNCQKQSAKRDAKNTNFFNSITLFQEFMNRFSWGETTPPKKEDSDALWIKKELKLEYPHMLHKTAWAIGRLLVDARTRPVHDLLLSYLKDMEFYKFLLKEYEDNRVLKTRDLRAIASFINKIKESTLARPNLRLDDFVNELELREVHNLPINGELATLSQDGVRIYTAHSSKGLEFHTVFVPFALEQQSWPVRSKGEVMPLPLEIYKSKEKVDEKMKVRVLKIYDELRLFYVASTRAKAVLIYTATPGEKIIMSRFLSPLGLLPRQASPKMEDKFLLDFLNGTQSPESFSSTSAILKDMVSKMNLTPTKLNNYLSCRRKFMYNYVLGLPGKKTPHLVFGNCAHKALEEVYGYYMQKKCFPEFKFYKQAFLKELEFEGVNEAIKHMCRSRLESLQFWYKEESKNPIMPLSLEADLSISFSGGLVFKGKFDKI